MRTSTTPLIITLLSLCFLLLNLNNIHLVGADNNSANAITVQTATVNFSQVGIDADFTGVILTVDNEGYNVSDFPISFRWEAGSNHSFAYNSPLIVKENCKRYVWVSTSGLSTAQNGTINVPSEGGIIEAYYCTEYYLKVKTDPESLVVIQGEGWYEKNAEKDLVAPEFVEVNDTLRYKFDYWNISGVVVKSNQITIRMDMCRTVTAHYATQYYLLVSDDIGGLSGISAQSGWYDKCSNITLTAPDYISRGENKSSVDYVFSHWNVNGILIRENPLNIHVSMPCTIIAHYVTPLNISLMVTDWSGEHVLQGLNLSIFDLDGDLIFSGISDENGLLNLTLKPGEYVLSAFSGRRKVAQQKVVISEPEKIHIRAWAYQLNVKCIDRNHRPMAGVVVSIYELLYAENTTLPENKSLVEQRRANETGIALFGMLWNGTYEIIVKDGKIIGREIIELKASDQITIKCNKTSLLLNVVSFSISEEPLSGAIVSLRGEDDLTIFRGVTDQNGQIKFDYIYVGNYRIFVDWLDRGVYSGSIIVEDEKELLIKCSVFRATFKIVDPSNNPLPYSQISIRRITGPGRTAEVNLGTKNIRADENGVFSILLPSGAYEFTFSSGIFFGKSVINLNNGDYSGVVQCSINLNIWLAAFLSSAPLLILSLLMERKKIKRYLEVKRYQGMLQKLENMYNGGTIEYKVYRKLREEYETKLMELGGRRRA